MGNLSNVLSNTLDRGNQILNKEINSRIHNNFHAHAATVISRRPSDLQLSRERIESAVDSWSNHSSEPESIDEYFAALGSVY